MVNYRRNYIKGGSYFFTITLRDRHLDYLVKHIDLLQNAMRKVKQEEPYEIKAMVVLPEHLHMIWQLPDEDYNYSQRIRKMKGYFTSSLKNNGILLKKDQRGEYLLWQRRFWEHTIKDEKDFENHIHYIHYNPVKHGLVNRVCGWPYSSFHQYVKKGLLELHWGGGDNSSVSENYGE